MSNTKWQDILRDAIEVRRQAEKERLRCQPMPKFLVFDFSSGVGPGGINHILEGEEKS